MTEWNKKLIGVLPAGDAPAVHQAMLDEGIEPDGERFFDAERATHVDPDTGDEYVVVDTSVRPSRIKVLKKIAAQFPDAKYQVVGEHNGQKWKDKDTPPGKYSDLERIEVEQ